MEKRYETTGSLAKSPLNRSFKKLDPVKLTAYVKEHPDAYLREIGEVFGCTDDAVRLALIKLGIMRKKTKEYKEREEQRRSEFTAEVSQIPVEQIVYVDETGMDQFVYREYARAPHGEAVFGAISGQKFNRVGIVAAQCKGTILSPLEYDGSMDSSLFEYRFENILLTELPPNVVIVMDNASFHRKSALLELIGRQMLLYFSGPLILLI